MKVTKGVKMSMSRRRMMMSGAALAAAAAAAKPVRAETIALALGETGPATLVKTRFKTQRVGEVEVFYREAGRAEAPVILLLHGFPSAGHMFRDLIPALAAQYRVIAPDLVGFGNTVAPPRGQFDYTFENLAKVMAGFTEALNIPHYALYVFDFGAPTGFRLAMAHPGRVTAIVTQNGNAYGEGLSDAWGPYRDYWADPSPEKRAACRVLLTHETIYFQYTHGADASLVAPDGYLLDEFYLQRPGVKDIQLDLALDYRTNVALYPQFHAYFRAYQPPLLAVWGKNDPFFLPAGAEAFKRDLPKAEINFFDTGHFALETHAAEIGQTMLRFLGAHL